LTTVQRKKSCKVQITQYKVCIIDKDQIKGWMITELFPLQAFNLV